MQTNHISTYKKFLLGALLHDLGKIIERTNSEFSHQKEGWKYLSSLGEEIALYAKYHHKNAILSFEKEEKQKKLLWLVHLADCLSAKERNIPQEFNPKNSLLSVFSVIQRYDSLATKRYFPLSLKNSEIVFPEKRKEIEIFYSEYRKIFEEFSPRFSFDLWLILLENLLTFVPAMTSQEETVSLYDHLKLTCAFASSLWYWYQEEEKNIFDKKFDEFQKKSEKDIFETEKKKIFLLIGGDFSGIQKFVYGTTHHKKALLRTKGRSLYLEFLSLDIIKEILNRLDLTFANVILNSGGHFYILAPNTRKTKEKIQEIKKEVNKFLYQKFKGIIYLALSYQEFSGEEISASPNLKKDDLKKRGEKIKNIFKNLHEKLSREKKQKFKEVLLEKNDKWKEENFEKELCQFCKLNPGVEKVFDGEKIKECEICEMMSEMGRCFKVLDISKKKYQKIGIWKTKGEKHKRCFEFPFSNFYLKDFDRFTLKEVNKKTKGITLINFYNLSDKKIHKKLKPLFEKIKEKNLNFLNSYFVSWYTSQIAEELDSLSKNSIGLKKIALLKADVDDLGALFKDGIDIRYRTFSNLATFSRLLDWFFKIYINWLGDIEEGLRENLNQRQGSKFGEFKNSIKWRQKFNRPQRNIQILYSGGDDLVVIGTWNEILDFALDLEWLFKEYVGENPNLHFSAGIVIIDKKFPIYKAIELAEKRLKEAKNSKGKESIKIFECAPVKWEELRTSLNDFVDLIREIKKDEKRAIIKIPRTVLYKILEVKEKFNKTQDLRWIIYLHYLLARNKALRENRLFEEYFSIKTDTQNTNYLKVSSKFKLINFPLTWLNYLSR